LGPLKSNPFPDSTPAFYVAYEALFNQALGGELQILRPLEQLTKGEVMQLGRDLPLELTFSCLQPVDGLHCGRCNKCAERRRAFREAGLEDPTRYLTSDGQ
jgi:7-cyano-7-deazaguanine synthase